MNDLIEALKKGVVIITFKKIDTGEIRIMPSTLNSEFMPNGSKIFSISPESQTIMVWSLDKKAWRDIRSDTIIEWGTQDD